MKHKVLILSALSLLFFATSCAAPEDEQQQGILLGDPKAPLEMIVYLDYQCPECKQFHDSILPTLENGYVKDGRLKIRLRDYPLIAGSNISHNAAWCAREFGLDKYHAFIDALYANQEAQRIFQLKEIGNKLGFTADFGNCIDQERYANTVNSLKNKGRADNVARTPTILLGNQRFNGASDLFKLLSAVEEQAQALKK